MLTAETKGKAPFEADGSLMHYPDSYWSSLVGHGERAYPEWRDIGVTYGMTLHLENYARGQSAAYFVWRNKATGATFPMFMTDMHQLLTSVGVRQGGVVTAAWRVRKRGQNYGIALALEGI